MGRKEILLALQTVLCVLTAALLIAGVIGIYREGAALRASGDVLSPVFTRGKVAERLAPVAPVAFAALALTLAGRVLGIRGEAPRGAKGAARDSEARPEPRRIAAIRAALLVLAGACLVAGALNGSLLDVLRKAVNICTECVGLG